MSGTSHARPPRRHGPRPPTAPKVPPGGLSNRERARRIEAVKAAFAKARARRLTRG